MSQILSRCLPNLMGSFPSFPGRKKFVHTQFGHGPVFFPDLVMWSDGIDWHLPESFPRFHKFNLLDKSTSINQ